MLILGVLGGEGKGHLRIIQNIHIARERQRDELVHRHVFELKTFRQKRGNRLLSLLREVADGALALRGNPVIDLGDFLDDGRFVFRHIDVPAGRFSLSVFLHSLDGFHVGYIGRRLAGHSRHRARGAQHKQHACEHQSKLFHQNHPPVFHSIFLSAPFHSFFV